ncbi:MAG: SDR family NAD(P)-dependent oxidoreductase [Oscillospiraceae bacterium]|nr:SDR family NAD(P)-dependent oxidoreductase [Oscillospiraceae bacterium]
MKYPYGKYVFLTGGSSGIGLATAELLASNGYTVFSASRNPTSTFRDFPCGGMVRYVALDVRDPGSIDSVTESVLAQADIGIVIHCAGIGIACAAEDSPTDAVDNLMKTNFNGVLYINKLFLPHLRRRGCGFCVIIGSVAGIFPIPFQSHYCASKAALDLYCAALRMELRGFGVRASLVMPGDTKTGFTNARRYEIDESSPYFSDCLKATQKMEKDERTGRPSTSVAHAILKLCARANPPPRTIIGFNYKLLAFLRRLLPDRIVEYMLRAIYMGRE